MTPIFVINLDRMPGRWAALSDQLDALGLSCERVTALDRLAPGAAGHWAAFADGSVGRDYPATLGDVCCSLTHQRLWQRIARMKSGVAIVLEDDARLSPVFAAYAAADLGALMRAEGIGVLKLEHWPGGERSRRYPLGTELRRLDFAGGAMLYRQAASFLGTCAYAITPETAGRLLAAYPHMGMPVDHFLFSRSAGRGYRIGRPGFVNPAPVLHDFPTQGSDILGERIASGMATRPQGWRRRWREAALRRGLSWAVRARRVGRVEMGWAGEGTPVPPWR